MTMVFNAHRYSGNLQQALEINDEILGLIRQHGLEGQPILMSTLSNRAMLLPLLDRHDEAGDLHRQALELTLARYPADGLRVARQRMFYGMALVQASQFDDALAQLTPALEVMRQKWPDNHVMTQMAVHWMGARLPALGVMKKHCPCIGKPGARHWQIPAASPHACNPLAPGWYAPWAKPGTATRRAPWWPKIPNSAATGSARRRVPPTPSNQTSCHGLPWPAAACLWPAKRRSRHRVS